MAFDTSQSAVLQEWASQLGALFARCEGAYSDLTLSGYRKDLEIFAEWCAENGEAFLPAHPRSIASFFNAQLETCSYATIRRRASAIRFAHVLSDLQSPIGHSEVYLALRRAARTRGRRPQQVLGLTRDLLDKMLAACPDTLSGKRDAALLSVGYDTLCRSSELAWMRVEDVRLDQARIYIPRSKNDPFGDGRIATLSQRSKIRLSEWLTASKLRSGALFRGLHTKTLGESNIETSSIRRILKNSAKRAGLVKEATRLSGHSMRVGAAQDLLVLGCDTLAIMTAGGWKNAEVVARYVENARIGQFEYDRSSIRRHPKP